jgi:hypothetical protein
VADNLDEAKAAFRAAWAVIALSIRASCGRSLRAPLIFSA